MEQMLNGVLAILGFGQRNRRNRIKCDDVEVESLCNII